MKKVATIFKNIWYVIISLIKINYYFLRYPKNYSNESFKFVGDIMTLINTTAEEKMNFINEIALVNAHTKNEIVKISIWTGVYDTEHAQESPFERIKYLKNQIEELKKTHEKN